MWLATLNPGRPYAASRRGRRGARRKLSAWQRMVKKYGGVMQALKARKKMKTGAKKRRHGRRKFRRNSFLTTALTSGGAKVLMNAGRKHRRRKIRSRRSVVSRAGARGRSRRAARRSKMARKTRRRRHRRTPPRGRGGRFLKSRSSHRRRRHRRVRRNPVLPISWNPGRRRRRRTRRNPLFLSRRGFSSRKHKGYRRLHRRRHSPRYWHNPRRRRHSRRYRNNPVLPISWNPVSAAASPIGAVTDRLKSFVDVKFWTETGVPAAVGFFGSKALGAQIYNAIPVNILTAIPGSPAALNYVRMGVDAVAGALLSWATGKFYDKKAGDAMWLGTIVNVSYSLLQNLLGGTAIASTIGLSGLGDDLASRMKSEIQKRVAASIQGGRLNGLGSYLRTTNARNLNGVGEFVTERSLRSSAAYSPGNALGDEHLGDPGF
jgi:hypothetical protein